MGKKAARENLTDRSKEVLSAWAHLYTNTHSFGLDLVVIYDDEFPCWFYI